jgi:hypothetical protein
MQQPRVDATLSPDALLTYASDDERARPCAVAKLLLPAKRMSNVSATPDTCPFIETAKEPAHL